MQFPDVCGFKLKDAVKLIKEQGIENYIIMLTAPPRLRNSGYGEESRIVRQRVTGDGKLELIVSNVVQDENKAG